MIGKTAIGLAGKVDEMQIAMIGAGHIGATLGKKWAAAGHSVWFGLREPADPRYAELQTTGKVVSVSEALAPAELVLLALPGGSVAEFARNHAAGLTGKIVVDATNNLRAEMMNGLSLLAQQVPGARLARAFSTLGWENFENPTIGGEQVDLFFCGDATVRAQVEDLIRAMGLRPVYLGGVDQAGVLDNLTRVWFGLVTSLGRGRHVALKLLSE